MSVATHVYCIGDANPVVIDEECTTFIERVNTKHEEGVALVMARVLSTQQIAAFGIATIAYVAPVVLDPPKETT